MKEADENSLPKDPAIKQFDKLWQDIHFAYREQEEKFAQDFLLLLENSPFPESFFQEVEILATQWVHHLRRQKPSLFLEALQTYPLTSAHGKSLMQLAEALLRIPDEATRHLFLKEKMTQISQDLSHASGPSSWKMHLSHLSIRLAGWALQEGRESSFSSFLQRLVPFKARQALTSMATLKGVQKMADQFVMGETLAQALSKISLRPLKDCPHFLQTYSFDSLGEAALSEEEAEGYFKAYQNLLDTLSQSPAFQSLIGHDRPSISVKLSALHPRYEFGQRDRVLKELGQRLTALALQARECNIGLTVDAEESERLMLSLELFEATFTHPSLKDWPFLGLAVQAYQKRALPVLRWLMALAGQEGKQIPVRLVKGAYWDSEIKRSQEKGLSDYPVFTRKTMTDCSYLMAAQTLLSSPHLYGQFGSHNAHTHGFILKAAQLYGPQKPLKERLEIQRLYGMGEELFEEIARTVAPPEELRCRVYGPVGSYKDLLGYFVRRLLENGANSSFMHQLSDPSYPLETLLQNPFEQLKILAKTTEVANPSLSKPADIFLPHRKNSQGIDLSDPLQGTLLETAVSAFSLGEVPSPTAEEGIEEALQKAFKAFDGWTQRPVEERAFLLEKLALLLEGNRTELVALLVKEAKKTIPNALGEVREAVDYCRYYAQEARRLLASPLPLPQQGQGVVGERNHLTFSGRGTFVCISPWNFPLAIFLGQIMAALVTGNCVIAKAAAQTSRLAQRAIELAYEAGIDKDVLHLLFGQGDSLGARLIEDQRTHGVAFTGSTAVARSIQLRQAQKGPLESPIEPLLAETGGINAMIVDSTALPEQTVADILTSAFDSAGQRCSSLRVLYVQEEIADKILTLLQGAMEALVVGDPAKLSTDIGPLIDRSVYERCQAKVTLLQEEEKKGRARFLCQCALPPALEENFFPPQVWEVFSCPGEETFGPLLQVIRYKPSELPVLLQELRGTRYGLTLGIQSRLVSKVTEIGRQVRVGNTYVNRSMIGATVGLQPFGGTGLSGTGPKAGGPHYLLRFMTEQTLSVNTMVYESPQY